MMDIERTASRYHSYASDLSTVSSIWDVCGQAAYRTQNDDSETFKRSCHVMKR